MRQRPKDDYGNCRKNETRPHLGCGATSPKPHPSHGVSAATVPPVPVPPPAPNADDPMRIGPATSSGLRPVMRNKQDQNPIYNNGNNNEKSAGTQKVKKFAHTLR